MSKRCAPTLTYKHNSQCLLKIKLHFITLDINFKHVNFFFVCFKCFCLDFLKKIVMNYELIVLNLIKSVIDQINETIQFKQFVNKRIEFALIKL